MPEVRLFRPVIFRDSLYYILEGVYRLIAVSNQIETRVQSLLEVQLLARTGVCLNMPM